MLINHDAWWWWLYSQTKSKVFNFSMFCADLRSHIGTNHIVHVCPLSVSQYPIGGIGNFSKCFPRFQVCMLFTITITILLKTTSFSQLTACIKYVHANTFQITCLHISNSNSGAKYQIWFFRISLVSPGKQGSIVHILTSAVHQRPQFSAALPPPANGCKMLKFQQQKLKCFKIKTIANVLHLFKRKMQWQHKWW